MKRIVLLFLLALALPMAAFASNSFDFTNAGGTLSGSSAGLTLTGSTLIAMGNGGMPITVGDPDNPYALVFRQTAARIWEKVSGEEAERRFAYSLLRRAHRFRSLESKLNICV